MMMIVLTLISSWAAAGFLAFMAMLPVAIKRHGLKEIIGIDALIVLGICIVAGPLSTMVIVTRLIEIANGDD